MRLEQQAGGRGPEGSAGGVSSDRVPKRHLEFLSLILTGLLCGLRHWDFFYSLPGGSNVQASVRPSSGQFTGRIRITWNLHSTCWRTGPLRTCGIQVSSLGFGHPCFLFCF